MARTFLDALRAAVLRYEMLVSGDTVVAAVSGGADSVALLVGLLALRESLGIAVAAAHLDHGLRGSESDADRTFVEDLARRLAVPLFCEVGQVPPGNLEAEARRLRYDFLERAAERLGATKIATGHTREDQAETVLLRVLRGAGRRGLSGIRPRRGKIIRPLILCDRLQVRSFLVERGLSWRRDRSNFDLSTERARIRHGFLPALGREFNPRLVSTLADLADLMREEDTLLDRLAAAGSRGETLDATVLEALEPPLARRAIRHWWRRRGSGRRLGRAHIEAVHHLALRPGGDGEIAVPGGAMVRTGRRLEFRSGPATRTETLPWQLALVPGEDVETPGGWRLRLTESTPGAHDDPSDDVCVGDADQIPAPLTVRNRRPGDRLRALGLAGHTSIKRLFAARGVPRHLRGDHPLVFCGEELLWVPGCARSDRALVGTSTSRCFVISVIRRPSEYA